MVAIETAWDLAAAWYAKIGFYRAEFKRINSAEIGNARSHCCGRDHGERRVVLQRIDQTYFQQILCLSGEI